MPLEGFAPSQKPLPLPPRKRCSTCSVQPPPDVGVSLKIVPQPPMHFELRPPRNVVPYKLPFLSKTSFPIGMAPSLFPVNAGRVWLVSNHHLPFGESLNTVPQPSGHALLPPLFVVP